MGAYVASQLVKAMIELVASKSKGRECWCSGLAVQGKLSRSPQYPHHRHCSRTWDYHVRVDVFDPWAKAEEANREYGLSPVAKPEAGAYDGIVLAVAHDEFRQMGAQGLRALGKETHVLYDLKYILEFGDADLRL